jgi:hypothetical protein
MLIIVVGRFCVEGLRRFLHETFTKASPAPTNSDPSISPQRTTFRSLTIELRQTIYLCAAGNPQNKELHVEYTLSGAFDNEEGVLHSEALDLLKKRDDVAEDFHYGALGWLTSYTICSVLVNESQPHMYLVRAL